jgi:hypothetical protein
MLAKVARQTTIHVSNPFIEPIYPLRPSIGCVPEPSQPLRE